MVQESWSLKLVAWSLKLAAWGLKLVACCLTRLELEAWGPDQGARYRGLEILANR